MKSLTELLEPIRARMEAATPGPWINKSSLPHSSKIHVSAGDYYICRTSERCADYGKQAEANAELIANAPTDIARLIEVVVTIDAALTFYVSEDSWSKSRDGVCPAITIQNWAGNTNLFVDGKIADAARTKAAQILNQEKS